jgi:hypothetical protein
MALKAIGPSEDDFRGMFMFCAARKVCFKSGWILMVRGMTHTNWGGALGFPRHGLEPCSARHVKILGHQMAQCLFA